MQSNEFALLVMMWLFVASGSEAQMKEGYTATGAGIHLHYLEAGTVTSLPELVLIPGCRLPAFLWNEQLQHFSKTTRVIALDPRSQGESSKTSDGNTPESRTQDLHDALMNLHVSRCVLVGWSQGAQDVAAYLQKFGTDLVAGVVFVDSPVSAGPAEMQIHKDFSRIILAGISTYVKHPAEYSAGMVRSLFKQPHADLDLVRVVKSTLQTPTDTGATMLAMDIFGEDRRPALTRLTKPALVIASSTSPLFDAQKEMASTIPNSKLILLESAGHAVFVDQPKNSMMRWEHSSNRDPNSSQVRYSQASLAFG